MLMSLPLTGSRHETSGQVGCGQRNWCSARRDGSHPEQHRWNAVHGHLDLLIATDQQHGRGT
jgi:hypothetical protein